MCLPCAPMHHLNLCIVCACEPNAPLNHVHDCVKAYRCTPAHNLAKKAGVERGVCSGQRAYVRSHVFQTYMFTCLFWGHKECLHACLSVSVPLCASMF